LPVAVVEARIEEQGAWLVGSLGAGGQPRRELSERCLPVAGGAASRRIEVSTAVARHTKEVAAAVASGE